MNSFEEKITSQNNSFCLNETYIYDDDYTPYPKRPETYIVPLVFGLIFFIGTFGNGTLILIFMRHKNMRNEPNIYIFSLAIGDLLVILFCVPFTSTIYTLESWPYGDVICKISEWTKDVSIGISVFTLTALSAERYCAIVNPMRRHTTSGRYGAKVFNSLTALFIWILAIIIALPAAIYSHSRRELLGFNRTIFICTPFPDKEFIINLDINYRHLIILFKFFTYYAVPLCIIACFYILMAIHLEASAKNLPGESQNPVSQIHARKKVAKLVLIFVVIFIVCFGPYHIFMLWFHLNPHSWKNFNNVWNAFRILGFCLSFFNSCINPIALYFISSTFRKYFNLYLFCCCCNHNNIIRKRGTTICETSIPTMVQFGSTLRRQNCNWDEASVVTEETAVYNLERI